MVNEPPVPVSPMVPLVVASGLRLASPMANGWLLEMPAAVHV